jgi:hypothetical protein
MAARNSPSRTWYSHSADFMPAVLVKEDNTSGRTQ